MREIAVHKAASLAQHLARDLGMPVRLSVTDNRSTMVSFRRAPSALRLRLHHMFLDAPVPVVQAVADYAGRGRSQAGRVLDEYISAQQPRIRQERDASDERFSPEGRCFDLQQIFDALNERVLPGRHPGAHRLGAGARPAAAEVHPPGRL